MTNDKQQEPVRLEDTDISTNADEVATVQEDGLVREEFLNEVADGA